MLELFGGASGLGWVAVKAVLLFAVAVIGLRLGERRTLAQLGAFDFAVAVAIGAIIGRTVTAPSTSFATGAVALITLLVAHRLVAFARRHSRIARLIDHRPASLSPTARYKIVNLPVPVGEVVPLLQIAPSKSNEERLLLVDPELASVLATVITRLRAGNDGAVPLVARYDHHERTTGPLLPHLFQRARGAGARGDQPRHGLQAGRGGRVHLGVRSCSVPVTQWMRQR